MDAQGFFTWCVVKRNLSKSSMKHTRLRYNYLFRWLENTPLTQNAVESFVLYLREKNLRNASINSYIRVINLIDIYERENGKDYNLLKKISYFPKQKKVPTILSYEEILAILNTNITYPKRNSGNYNINEIYKNVWYLISSTGCRLEEALTLKCEDLLLGIDSGFVLYKNTKTLSDRKVPLPPIVVERLKEQIKNKNASEFVFTTSKGNKIAAQTMEEDIKRRSRLANINKHIYPHCFRNSYIMELLKRKCDPITIAKLVGHEDVNSTLGYTKYNDVLLIEGAEHHPMFYKTLTPDKIVKKIRDTLDGLKLLEDNRFKVDIAENNRGFSFNLRIK